jgi:biopolymer transport protein ExbD
MTPLIDVVFLLLIFFICTASFQAAENLLPTSLSIAGGNTIQQPIQIEPEFERIVAQARREGGRTEWTVNERPCQTLADVHAVLRAVVEIDATLPVIIDVAPDVPLGDMIDVYDLCRIVGFEKIQFAARRQ